MKNLIHRHTVPTVSHLVCLSLMATLLHACGSDPAFVDRSGTKAAADNRTASADSTANPASSDGTVVSPTPGGGFGAGANGGATAGGGASGGDGTSTGGGASGGGGASAGGGASGGGGAGGGTGTCTPGAPDGLITFEELPNHTLIKDQYSATHGLTFSTNGSGLPMVGEVGGSCQDFSPGTAANVMEGWVTQLNVSCDQLLGGQDIVGSKFLSTTGRANQLSSHLIVDFSRPTREFSFDIIDIDQYEKYQVTAYAGTAVVDTLVLCGLNPPSAGKPCNISGIVANSKPYPVSFSDPQGQDRITKIEVNGIKSQGEIGVAFDHFAPRRLCN